MKIDSARIFAGKRRVKQLKDQARAQAEAIITAGGSDLEAMHEVMLFNYGLREKHIETVMVVPNGDHFVALLALNDTAPRGMANVIAAPNQAPTEEDAEGLALFMLTAAWVAILEFKAEVLANTADPRFRFRMSGGVILDIPHEIMSYVANRVPMKLSPAEREQIRQVCLARFDAIIGGDLTVEKWAALDDKKHTMIMHTGAELLCGGFFGQDAAKEGLNKAA